MHFLQNSIFLLLVLLLTEQIHCKSIQWIFYRLLAVRVSTMPQWNDVEKKTLYQINFIAVDVERQFVWIFEIFHISLVFFHHCRLLPLMCGKKIFIMRNEVEYCSKSALFMTLYSLLLFPPSFLYFWCIFNLVFTQRTIQRPTAILNAEHIWIRLNFLFIWFWFEQYSNYLVVQ